jgi:hypothetical protein
MKPLFSLLTGDRTRVFALWTIILLCSMAVGDELSAFAVLNGRGS